MMYQDIYNCVSQNTKNDDTLFIIISEKELALRRKVMTRARILTSEDIAQEIREQDAIWKNKMNLKEARRKKNSATTEKNQ